MTHADAFLQAVLDAPDDDAPRLLFADWLDEHGDPDRAEFIRVQIALAGRPADHAVAGLRSRQNALLALHDDEWSEPVRGVAFAWAFHRGFLEWVQVRPDKFLNGVNELFGRAPIRQVHLHEDVYTLLGAHRMAQLADCHFLIRLTGLDLSGNFVGRDGLQPLLVSPWLGGLTSLGLRQCQISDRGVRALAAWPHLTRLTHLDLGHNGIGPAGVRALARALETWATNGDPPRLRSLPLHGNPLGESGRRAVHSSPLLVRASSLPAAERLSRRAPKEY